MMDKSWISADRLSDAYEVGVNTFIEFAQSNDPNSDLIRCPCKDCVNLWSHPIKTVRFHLFASGFNENYLVWSFHGEKHTDSRCSNKAIPPDFNYTRYMVHDAFRDVEKEPESLKSLLEECEKPLFEGSKYNALSGLLIFQHIKGEFGWSEASFKRLLGALKDVLPQNNTIPKSLYESKKLLTWHNVLVSILFNFYRAMILYASQSGSNKRVSLTWHNVLCPHQPPGSSLCGYYVCKFMKEVVEDGIEVMVLVGDAKEEYTARDIDEIRTEWVSYVSNFIMT